VPSTKKYIPQVKFNPPPEHCSPQWKGPILFLNSSRPFKDQSGAWRNGTSFGLHDLEALKNVALEAKEWRAAQGLKH